MMDCELMYSVWAYLCRYHVKVHRLQSIASPCYSGVCVWVSVLSASVSADPHLTQRD